MAANAQREIKYPGKLNRLLEKLIGSAKNPRIRLERIRKRGLIQSCSELLEDELSLLGSVSYMRVLIHCLVYPWACKPTQIFLNHLDRKGQSLGSLRCSQTVFSYDLDFLLLIPGCSQHLLFFSPDPLLKATSEYYLDQPVWSDFLPVS